jgi:saccharopine dehydrogenase-like NADP-dependent oxidoreductase
MKTILVIGAGRSSSALITYLLNHSNSCDWSVRVGDVNLKQAQDRVGAHARGNAFVFDINDQQQREKEIKGADIVVSMLPAFMHGQVAEDCVRFGKHLVTASYVSDKMKSLDAEARTKGVILLNEIGLDPGIDHMSAMQIIDDIRSKGGEMNAFYSYCGGLVAPESNDNPWGYKFSWNPRNVILAGQGTAQYIRDGKYRYLPYQRLFSEATSITVDGHGKFDAYANRDSLSYRAVYGLENIPTMLRGTLRHHGFCEAWNVFVQLGITDDTWKLEDSTNMTYAELVTALLPEGKGTLRERLSKLTSPEAAGSVMDMVEWTGVLSDTKIGLNNATPAQALQKLLEEKWKLKHGDKDMVVMQHIFEYKLNGKQQKITSSLVVKGDDEVHTAMAKTVGLPAAIAVKLILTGKYNAAGVVVPVRKEIYEPVLSELAVHGIVFSEVHS